MRISYNLTQKDYNDLWEGKVKYLIQYYEKISYGTPGISSTAPRWKKLLWRYFKNICLFKHFFHYLNNFQYYYILVKVGEGMTWNLQEDLKVFIQEKGLNPGDVVWIGGIVPLLNGKSFSYWGGSKWVVLIDGFAKIGKLI